MQAASALHGIDASSRHRLQRHADLLSTKREQAALFLSAMLAFSASSVAFAPKESGSLWQVLVFIGAPLLVVFVAIAIIPKHLPASAVTHSVLAMVATSAVMAHTAYVKYHQWKFASPAECALRTGVATLPVLLTWSMALAVRWTKGAAFWAAFRVAIAAQCTLRLCAVLLLRFSFDVAADTYLPALPFAQSIAVNCTVLAIISSITPRVRLRLCRALGSCTVTLSDLAAQRGALRCSAAPRESGTSSVPCADADADERASCISSFSSSIGTAASVARTELLDASRTPPATSHARAEEEVAVCDEWDARWDARCDERWNERWDERWNERWDERWQAREDALEEIEEVSSVSDCMEAWGCSEEVVVEKEDEGEEEDDDELAALHERRALSP